MGKVKTHTSCRANLIARKPIVRGSTQIIPIVGIDVGLTQDTAQSADRYLLLARHDGRVDGFSDSSYKLDVATPSGLSRRILPLQAVA